MDVSQRPAPTAPSGAGPAVRDDATRTAPPGVVPTPRDDTPRTGLRDRKKRSTRRALMTAALDLYERQGFHATSLEDIAAAVGVSPRTLTRYFGSKEGVILSFEDGYRAAITAELARRPADEPPLDALRNAVFTAIARRDPDADESWYPRAQRLIHNTPALLAQSLERDTREQKTLARVIAHRIGDDRETTLYPKVLVATVFAAVHTAKDAWQQTPDRSPETFDVLLREALSLLDSGLTPPGGPTSR
ncbi:TetR/AcrR family transcriptional regulator [Streptomyces sp. NPDC003077]|uniref:TetR/AcrR family transcriptional regulator n=1 Tax=Streptomyces sp. NPDC003077 TaxID=3154443 RepID=UPI0033A052E2